MSDKELFIQMLCRAGIAWDDEAHGGALNVYIPMESQPAPKDVFDPKYTVEVQFDAEGNLANIGAWE